MSLGPEPLPLEGMSAATVHEAMCTRKLAGRTHTQLHTYTHVGTHDLVIQKTQAYGHFRSHLPVTFQEDVYPFGVGPKTRSVRLAISRLPEITKHVYLGGPVSPCS